MAGLYIHIPFCKSRCAYCAFYSQTDFALQERFVAALARELALRSQELPPQERRLQTLYWGGGTPSLLTPDQLEYLVATLHQYYTFAPQAEWTFEANPDDLSLSYAQQLYALGFNRVSMGVQSFCNEELKMLQRRHTAKEVYRAIEALRQVGIQNLSIDLIYALPKQSLQRWQQNLCEAIALEVPHLSAYNLTYEENTLLWRLAQKGSLTPLPEQDAIAHYKLLVATLAQANFWHYEVSNFARPHYQAQHNSSYWQGASYLGLGPSAHSYYHHQRRANTPQIKEYVCALEQDKLPPHTVEKLTSRDERNEMVMTRLRTAQGIDLQRFETQFGAKALHQFLDASTPFLQQTLLHRDDTLQTSLDAPCGSSSLSGRYMRATPEGVLLLDTLTSELFEL